MIRTMPDTDKLSHREVRAMLIEKDIMHLDASGYAHVDLRKAMDEPEFRGLFETLIGPFLGYW
jgi:hypothetical protein